MNVQEGKCKIWTCTFTKKLERKLLLGHWEINLWNLKSKVSSKLQTNQRKSLFSLLTPMMMSFLWEEPLENLSSKAIMFTLLTWLLVQEVFLIMMLLNIFTFWKMSSIQKCSKKVKMKTLSNSTKILNNKQVVLKNTSATLYLRKRTRNSRNSRLWLKDSSEAVRPKFPSAIWECLQQMFTI